MVGFLVPDGNDALRDDVPAVVELIERTARWVHPDTFRALPVWAPHTARGLPLYDATWTRRRTNTKQATGVTTDKPEGNIAASDALVSALDAKPRPKNWTVCHIWGYDDPTFSTSGAVVQDPRYFSCVANMIWLPTALKGFTDALPEVKDMLRVCAFHLYGWACEHPSVKERAAVVTGGWEPPGYPLSWPTPSRPGVLPLNTAPYSLRIQAEIRRRKAKIKADLERADWPNYPAERVREVLQFWQVDLNT